MLYNGSEKPVEIDYDVMGLIWKYDLLDFETYLFQLIMVIMDGDK